MWFKSDSGTLHVGLDELGTNYTFLFIVSCFEFSYSVSDSSFCHPVVITGEGLHGSDASQPSAAMTEIRQIHEENLKKISSMSEKEILEEQAKLKQIIGR